MAGGGGGGGGGEGRVSNLYTLFTCTQHVLGGNRSMNFGVKIGYIYNQLDNFNNLIRAECIATAVSIGRKGS